MNALDALHTRNSVAQLTEPAPSDAELNNIFQAAMRASDHRRLRPWKFLVIEGDARHKLAELMLNIKLQDQPDMPEEKQQDLLKKPLRAPMIVITIAKIRDNEKVPNVEQLLSAGGATQLMLAAAHAQGVGAVWRTGDIAYDPRLHEGLKLEAGDTIVGFVYLGTPKTVKRLAEMNPSDYVSHWQG